MSSVWRCKLLCSKLLRIRLLCLLLPLLIFTLGCVVELDWLGENIVTLALRDAICCMLLLAKSEEAIALRNLGHRVRNYFCFNY